MTSPCALVCSGRRRLADRHLLPFPWTLSLRRRRCPSASHHSSPSKAYLSLSTSLSFPFGGAGVRGGGGGTTPSVVPVPAHWQRPMARSLPPPPSRPLPLPVLHSLARRVVGFGLAVCRGQPTPHLAAAVLSPRVQRERGARRGRLPRVVRALADPFPALRSCLPSRGRLAQSNPPTACAPAAIRGYNVGGVLPWRLPLTEVWGHVVADGECRASAAPRGPASE